MNKTLETSKIFIDTQVFIAANFQFSSGRLKKLSELNKKDKITIFLTDITIREIVANIEETVEELNNYVKKFQSQAKLLRKIPVYDAIFNFDKNVVLEDVKGEFKKFIELGIHSYNSNPIYSVTIIPVKNVSIESIFDKYFNQQPPFGEGKKKAEFPDAFIIAALEQWCEDNKEFMYVISNDSDMKNACLLSRYLIPLATLDELFDLINAEDEYISSIAHSWFTNNKKEIEQKIIDNFENEIFSLEDYEGEVDNIRVKNIILSNENLIEIEDEALSFTVQAKISYLANVTYPDPDMTYYDKEDGECYVFDSIKKTLKREENISVQIEMSFDRDDPHNLEFIDIYLETNGEIGINIDNYHSYPYK